MLRHSIRANTLTIALRQPTRSIWPSPNAVASSSRHPLSPFVPHPLAPPRYSYSLFIKGKGKESHSGEGHLGSGQLDLRRAVAVPSGFSHSRTFGRQPSSSVHILGVRPRPSPSHGVRLRAPASSTGAMRSFHATSRREALPLVPALGALLKVCNLVLLLGATHHLNRDQHTHAPGNFATHTYDGRIKTAPLVLPHRHARHVPHEARSVLALKGQARAGSVTRG